MDLNEAIEKTDELLIVQDNNFKESFLEIGLVEKDGLSSRIVKGPLYSMIKLFDIKLKDNHKYKDRNEGDYVYLIKPLNPANARKIRGLLKHHPLDWLEKSRILETHRCHN